MVYVNAGLAGYIIYMERLASLTSGMIQKQI